MTEWNREAALAAAQGVETLYDIGSDRRHLGAAITQLRAAIAEIERLRIVGTEADDEVCQVLGKALGYLWYKDDQRNFPNATEASGVCVGEHVALSIAAEAAKMIERLRNTGVPCELDCPACGVAHVDEPKPKIGWLNPPHRVHICHSCGQEWQPFDVATFGVKSKRAEAAKLTLGAAQAKAAELLHTATVEINRLDDALLVAQVSEARMREAVKLALTTLGHAETVAAFDAVPGHYRIDTMDKLKEALSAPPPPIERLIEAVRDRVRHGHDLACAKSVNDRPPFEAICTCGYVDMAAALAACGLGDKP